MRRLHLVVGLISIVAFIATGQYMDRVHGHLYDMNDGPRMIFRSAHIYLLYAALLNVLLGTYLEHLPAGAFRRLQQLASLIILVLPALFLMAFATEPRLAGLARPWARPAIYLSLVAVLLHLIAYRGSSVFRGRE